MKLRITLTALLLSITTIATAELQLPALFSDNMVLQRDQYNFIWGWTDPGEQVTVEFDGFSDSTTAQANGGWVLQIPPRPLGDPKTITVSSGDSITISNILMGDVWVCSGQSNMQWTVDRSANPEEEKKNANYPNIRYFKVPSRVAVNPQVDVNAEWVATTPDRAGGFSAVAYYFGRTLHENLDVPIGLISTSWGGTAIESWISQDATDISETFTWLNNEWQPDIESKGDAMVNFYKDRNNNPKPETKRGMGGAPNVPSFNYNAMIAPLWQFGVKGSIWYQGESNASRAYQYRDLMKTMIRDWRAQFRQGDLPFFITQLANFRERKAEPGESDWAELREAQLMATEMDNVGMAVIIDIGEADDIHPKNKQDVGRRLAQQAMNIAYEMDVIPGGPVYTSMRSVRDHITLRFDHVGDGLTTPDDAKLTGFQIAGEDKNWVWADAEIRGKTVRVWSDNIEDPVAVRYGWADNPDCNLYNEEGFPATPFRTDDWTISTRNNR